ncbi:MAG: glycoside hydrolase [Opitutaceae bacterium]|nr:glycoside hydrolase [Opitutaceae bacterium]
MKNPSMTIVAICLAIGSAPFFAKADNATGAALDEAVARRLWQGSPGLERTSGGRLFFTWFTGGTYEPDPANRVVLCYSDDGGKTHSPLQVMAAPKKEGERYYNPTPWMDPKGRLWYIFCHSNIKTGLHGVYARICENPDAPEPVFGPMFRVGFDVPYSFRMNKPTVLSSGEWIMPVAFFDAPVHLWSLWNAPSARNLQGAGISHDEGKTWRLRGSVTAPHPAQEGMITELKDGRLWMLMRTGAGHLWESFSADKGATWSKGQDGKIASPGSRFFIRRLSSGNLLLVNHYNFDRDNKDAGIRSHLTAQISTDDGRTWNGGLLLDPRNPVSYPDGVEDKDGVIWIIYDRDRRGAGEILMAKFREEDAMQGKNVSGTVVLRHIINRLAADTSGTGCPEPALK